MPPGFDMTGSQLTAFDGSLVMLAVYGVVILVMLMFALVMLAVASLPVFFLAMAAIETVLYLAQNTPDPIGKFSKLAGLVFRGLRRNLVRTSLSYAALFVLTGMLTFIYSIVSFLGTIARDKEDNLQVIMTERFSIPSQMPPAYATQLKTIIETKLSPENRPADIDSNFMTWSFIGGSMDPEKFTAESGIFLFALEPDSILTMMNDQGLNREDLGDEGYQQLVAAVELLKQDKRNVIIGQDRLRKIGKEVGDEMKIYSFNYKQVTFDYRIVATFPSASRYGQSAMMRADYLEAKLSEYKAKTNQNHPLADKALNLIWVRLPTKASYEQLAAIVNEPSTFGRPRVKMETASAGISSFLDAYKDIVWGMKYLIMPAIMIIMCLVVGITITISVRERLREMAVMKVLGFQPWHVTAMIAGEAVLVGLFGSLLSTWCVYFIPLMIRSSGIKFPIAFFSNFKAPIEIVWYGPILGVLVGLVGALLPAITAQRVKASQIFSKIT